MASQIKKLQEEKLNLIKKYIDLKKEHQNLYFLHQETMKHNSQLKNEVANLKKEMDHVKTKTECKCKQNLLSENQRLQAKVNQMRRSASITVTPAKLRQKHRNSGVFEVEQLIEHRGRKPNREFLVRWKNFEPSNDSWEKEINLSCPKILKDYLKKNRLA